MSTLFVGPVSCIAPHEWSGGDQGPYGPTPGDLRRTYGTVRRVFYCCFREGLRTPASPDLRSCLWITVPRSFGVSQEGF